jgi:hypothetical protein
MDRFQKLPQSSTIGKSTLSGQMAEINDVAKNYTGRWREPKEPDQWIVP